MTQTSATRRRLIGIMLVATALLLGVITTHAAGARMARLKFTERYVVALPSSFNVAGATPDHDGGFLVWFHGSPGILRLSRDGTAAWLRTAAVKSVVSAAPGRDKGMIDVLDTAANAIIVLDSTRVLERDVLRHPRAAWSAAKTSDGWLLIAPDAAGKPVASMVLWPSNIEARLSLDFAAPRDSAPGSVAISVRNDTAVLIERYKPFRLTVLTGAGVRGVSFVASLSDSLRGVISRNDQQHTWVALAASEYNGYYLESLGDARTGERLLLLCDGRGRLLRFTEMATPMAIITTAPALHRALAVRRTRDEELVVYDVRESWLP